MTTECPFVVGERYKSRDGRCACRFVILIDEAAEDSRAVFVTDNGNVISRFDDGRAFNVESPGDILPEPLPRVMYVNKRKAVTGCKFAEVWIVFESAIVDGNHDLGAGALAEKLIPHIEQRYAALAESHAGLLKALQSIAANTCCDSCQEAALVAKQAIARAERVGGEK